MEGMLCDTGFDDEELDMTPKSQTAKGKRDKLDFTKMKNFCSSRSTIKKGDSDNEGKHL
jgi:hypothetical protein